MSITLTDGQQNALEEITAFLADPIETVFVLSGYSGTGKTTLVETFIARLDSILKTIRLLNPQVKNYEVALTATTNKAAEAFSHLTGQEVRTIHSFLGLRVVTDYKTMATKLVPRTRDVLENFLLFVDEASYIDSSLLQTIFAKTKNCKIIFMGDPAQLTPVKAVGTPVFNANFKGAELTQVVRQAEGNPIVDLSTKFRNTVNTGEFFNFVPDGQAIQYLPREAFNQAIEAEFIRSDWHYADSKVLAWTNKCVIAYNKAINDHVTGDPAFQVGDYAICNKYLATGAKNYAIKTDQTIQITSIEPDSDQFGVLGNYFTLDHMVRAFMPKSLADKKQLLKEAKNNQQYHLIETIENQWADLRNAYACTVNKSQGSTYERVFIDLDDIRRCNSGDTIARMLYVGVSRAKQQVFLTGDIA